MTCPVCGASTKVIDSAKEVDCVYRCRECTECGCRFYTEETETKAAKNRLRNIRYKRRDKNDKN